MPNEVAILGWVIAAALAAGWIWSARKLTTQRSITQKAEAKVAEVEASTEAVTQKLVETQAILGRRGRDAERQIQHANEDFARALLPVETALSRALEAKQADLASTREGISMVHRLLEQALTNADMTAIRPKPGERFDPKLHESIGMEPDSVPPECQGELRITQVGRTGWLLHDRLVQAAEVMVRREAIAAGSEPDPPESEPETVAVTEEVAEPVEA